MQKSKPALVKQLPLMAKLEDVTEPWRKEWQNMPEFAHENLEAWKSILVHFASAEHMQAFAKLVGQNITDTTKYIWYPKPAVNKVKNEKRYVDQAVKPPR